MNYTGIILRYTGLVENQYGHGCTPTTFHEHIVNDWRYYHIEVFPLQMIQAEFAAKHFSLFGAEALPYDNAYIDQVKIKYQCRQLHKHRYL